MVIHYSMHRSHNSAAVVRRKLQYSVVDVFTARVCENHVFLKFGHFPPETEDIEMAVLVCLSVVQSTEISQQQLNVWS